MICVLEKCDDGWYVGTSQRTGLFGTFPGNYVERVWWEFSNPSLDIIEWIDALKDKQTKHIHHLSATHFDSLNIVTVITIVLFITYIFLILSFIIWYSNSAKESLIWIRTWIASFSWSYYNILLYKFLELLFNHSKIMTFVLEKILFGGFYCLKDLTYPSSSYLKLSHREFTCQKSHPEEQGFWH